MNRKTRLLVPALLALALCVPAFAEEPAAPVATPSTYASALAKLGAPSAKNAFSFEGDLLAGGNVVGMVKLDASLAEDDGAAVWSLKTSIAAGGGAMAHDEEVTYDARLMPVGGRLTQKGPDGEKSFSWTFADNKVTLTDHKAARTESMDAPKKVIPHEGAFQSSVTTLFLFCGLIGHEEGSYKADLLETDKAKFIATTFTCGASGTWAGRAAKLVKGSRTDGKTLEAGFDAATGELLGAKFGEGGNVSFEFRKLAPTGYFDVPAKTAQQAAVQAGLAFAIADLELLDRVTHWPSVHAKHTEENPDQPIDVDGYRSLLMTRFAASLKPQGERSAIAPALESMAPNFELEETDGDTIVKFGPMFRNLEIHVGEIDGVWYLVQFPDKPKK